MISDIFRLTFPPNQAATFEKQLNSSRALAGDCCISSPDVLLGIRELLGPLQQVSWFRLEDVVSWSQKLCC